PPRAAAPPPGRAGGGGGARGAPPPPRAARALHVHVNTVAQRLDRIASLLDGDWAQPDRALELQLALRLRRLRSS
ncbi:MAG: helix-turn-helix domain-containing protein, partial [Pseudonocardia sp.]|nr:helix-turn-helix domain-containing protein [Pseudonocardia sp.]